MLIATMFATHSAQSLEQSLAAARLTRFVHRKVSANLECWLATILTERA